ncbi:glycosyltransferase [Candidatus Saccharibacteria bacterium]|nr:glycosyltransferase [Candidatus Saccharibacteria bacterium]
MKVLVVGGGSGGHITPAVAVVREILEEKPRARVEFWTDKKYYKNVVKITTEIGVAWGEESRVSGKRQYIQVRKVAAGKFRRYAGWSLADYFKNWDTTLKDLIFGNIGGLIGFMGGIFQSFFRMLLKKNRPDVIFLKGGFVGLPVGIVARFYKIPYVIHESDATPGLANRLLVKHATKVATSLPVEEIDGVEPDPKVVLTGVPVAPEFKRVSETKQKQLKKAFGFDEEKPLVVITGGSQGAQHINEAVREILPEMLKFTSVGLVAGRSRYEEMVDLKKYEDWDKAKLKSNFRMWAFNSAMNELMGAADVVVSRAGATTIAELAALAKAVILVPFEQLPGSHQVKNAERLLSLGAVVMVKDGRMVNQPGILLEEVQRLVRSPKVRKDLAAKLHETYKPKAAKDLADILIKLANDTGGLDEKE